MTPTVNLHPTGQDEKSIMRRLDILFAIFSLLSQTATPSTQHTFTFKNMHHLAHLHKLHIQQHTNTTVCLIPAVRIPTRAVPQRQKAIVHKWQEDAAFTAAISVRN